MSPSRSAYLELGARPVAASGCRAVQHEEVLVVIVVLEGDRLEVGGVDQELVCDAQVDLEAVVGHAADVRVAGLVHGRELGRKREVGVKFEKKREGSIQPLKEEVSFLG
jgi:hypothetical protein